jgi:hypothetical protein
MASRPVFVPAPTSPGLVREISVEFTWVPGMAASQKKKNVSALHAAAALRGSEPILEVSSKSDIELGRRLSAFSLKSTLPDGRSVSLESAFQGSKIFERGGPYFDLYDANPKDAKRDERLREHGKLTGFRLLTIDAPTEPKTLFYDWLYVRALAQHEDYLTRLQTYAGFTDIEFNPKRSLNCQARSCALFVALSEIGMVSIASRSPQDLAALVTECGDEQGTTQTLF